MFNFLVTPDTVLILVNALYFKADWVHPFPVTRPSPFYITENETVTIDMMSLSKDLHYKYDEKLEAQILELPYKVNKVVQRSVSHCEAIILQSYRYLAVDNRIIY